MGESDKLNAWLQESAPDCGDNSCLFGGRGKGGMRTNGGCRCFKDLLPTSKRIFVERMWSALSSQSATVPMGGQHSIINAEGRELPAVTSASRQPTGEDPATALQDRRSTAGVVRDSAQQPAPSAPSSDVPTYGWRLWRDDKRQWRIAHDDFKHDADLILTGDFKDENEAMEFAAGIARRLSEPSATLPPKKWRLDEIVSHVLEDLFAQRGLLYPLSHHDMRLVLRSAELYLESEAYVNPTDGGVK